MLTAVVLLMAMAGCAPAFWQGVSQGLAASSNTPGVAVPKLMVFGGPGHQTYLGCLSCSGYDSESVFNDYGPHGGPYSVNSIHNPYGQFGSAYSIYGACNPFASDPPVIVDERGNFYGRLTVNRFHPQASRDNQILSWLEQVVCKK